MLWSLRTTATAAAIVLLVTLLGWRCVATAAPLECPTPRQAPAGPALWIPDVVAAAGATATIAVTLTTDGALIAGMQTDVTFPVAAPILARANAKPDCTVNPDIDKGATTFAFLPQGCTGTACTAARAQVLALLNVDPIPDGSTLFTCTIAIPADASPLLDYRFDNTILATGSGTTVADAGDQDGQVCPAPSPPTATASATSSATPTPSPTPTPASAICAGDCDGDGVVTVDEVVTLVNIALAAAPPSACPHRDSEAATVDITLVIQAVRNALGDCPR